MNNIDAFLLRRVGSPDPADCSDTVGAALRRDGSAVVTRLVERVDPNALSPARSQASTLGSVRSTVVAGLVEAGPTTGVNDPGYIATP